MKHLLLIAILFFGIEGKAQNVFEKKILGDLSHGSRARKMIRTSDHGYAILAYLKYDQNIYLIKLDSNYRQEWSRNIYIYTCEDHLSSLIETKDNGFVILGSYYINNCSIIQPFMIKINKKGEQEWAKVLETNLDVFPSGIIEANNKDLIVACSTHVEEILLLHFDEDANLLFSKLYGGKGTAATVNNIILEEGGDFTISGLANAEYESTLQTFPFIASFDKNANIKWKKAITAVPGLSIPRVLIKTNDSGYGMLISSAYFAFVFKTDRKGKFEWGTTINDKGIEEINDLISTSDGDFIVAGYSNNYDGYSTDNIFISKITLQGQTEWSKVQTNGCCIWRRATSIIQAPDKGFILAGEEFYSEESYNPELILIKLDSTGKSCSNFAKAGKNTSFSAITIRVHLDSLPPLSINVFDISPIYAKASPLRNYCSNHAIKSVEKELVEYKSEARLYPNPAKDYLQLKINSDKNTSATIQITGISGAILSSQKTVIETGSNTIYLNVSFLKPGSYFIKIIANNKQEVLKFIKQG